ncbi:MAG: sigma-70 family RNA polymerase sigma factor [Gemmatimonadaceae bacterium]|nr:sigma-70 family RNA polymerase sigma factor [Gemmatimonadaceae bacterium]
MRASRDDTTEPSLYATLYDELKRVASRQLQGSGPCAGLCTTDLVHEAYLKLSATPDAAWENRAHFFAAAARAMRQVLVDAARRAGAARRGSGEGAVTLTGGVAAFVVPLDDILALDDALTRLRERSERLHQVVELRFFGGMRADEIATVLGVTERTVERDWAKARLVLARELGTG